MANSVGSRQDNASGFSDFGYINVRIRGMSQRLISQTDLERLVKMKKLEEIEGFLQNSDYAADIKELSRDINFSGPRISLLENALQHNLVKSFQRIRGLLAGEPLELYLAVIAPLEIYNVKTLLRGCRRKTPPEQIYDSLLPVGRLKAAQLKELSQLTDSRRIVSEILAHGLLYIGEIEKHLDSYYYSNKLNEIEHALDLCQYEYMTSVANRQASKKNYKLLMDYNQLLVDLANIRLILKLAVGRISQSESVKYFIPGGKKISRSDYMDMVFLADPNRILKKLLSIDICQPLEKRMIRFKESNDISLFDRSLTAGLLTRLRNFSKYDPLGLSVMLRYIESKQAEVVNLRVVMNACLFEMPEKMAKEELVFG
ncbi:MAG: V-type ATPase subunit [bacterium]